MLKNVEKNEIKILMKGFWNELFFDEKERKMQYVISHMLMKINFCFCQEILMKNVAKDKNEMTKIL